MKTHGEKVPFKIWLESAIKHIIETTYLRAISECVHTNLTSPVLYSFIERDGRDKTVTYIEMDSTVVTMSKSEAF